MAAEAVYKYLLNTNRPYSANDITLNLHKEFGKAAIQKGLDELVDKSRIREKVYGKQKVYCILQTDPVNIEQPDKANLDEEIKQKQQTLKDIQKELTTKEVILKELLSQKTTFDLESENKQLSETNENLKERLKKLTSGNVKLVTVDERNKVEKEHETIKNYQRKRKRMAMDVLDSILEGYPKSKSCLYEEIGIELDP